MMSEIIGGIGDLQTPLVKGPPLHKIVPYFRNRFGQMPYGSPDFETASPIGEENREALVKWMLSLPEDRGYHLFRQSGNLRQISDDAATHKALETMYMGPKPEEDEDKFFWARLFIENIHNSMAVRNRLRIVEKEFEAYMDVTLKEREEVEVLSIAAGSSRAIMEVLARLNGVGYDQTRLRMVDLNREALDDGRNLALELQIHQSVEFIRAHFLSFRRYLEDGYSADFIEIVGLLDYLPGDHIISLLSEVRQHLTPKGMVLYSNIMPNDEQDFTHRIVGWPQMQYREAGQLVGFAKQAGFDRGSITVVPEPLGIYNIVSAIQQ